MTTRRRRVHRAHRLGAWDGVFMVFTGGHAMESPLFIRRPRRVTYEHLAAGWPIDNRHLLEDRNAIAGDLRKAIDQVRPEHEREPSRTA